MELLDTYRQCKGGTPHMRWDPDEHEYVPDGLWMFDSKGANNALELLGKSIGMYTDNLNHMGEVGVQIIDDIPKNTGQAD